MKLRFSTLVLTILTALFAVLLAACVTDDAATDNTTGPSGNNSTLTADTTEPSVTWQSTATQYRNDTNLRVAYVCPDSGTASVVWGSVVYTDDSSVCTAAVHSGLITFATGGRVVIEMRAGRTSYDSLTRNGVTSYAYGSWGWSYIFP